MVKERLKEGYCVVIGLQSTGEAALNASDLSCCQSPSLISTTRVILKNFVEKHFPSIAAPSDGDPTGNKHMILPSKSFSGGSPILECNRMKADLLGKINQLILPSDFLDTLISELGGSDEVAEMTGRQVRLEKEGNHYVLAQRSSKSAGIDSINGS